MSSLNIKMLEKLDIENLEKVKYEAELNNSQILETDNIITAKANTFLQFLIILITTFIGFAINQVVEGKLFELLTHATIIMIGFISYCIHLLLGVSLYPKIFALNGCAPSILVEEDVYSLPHNDKNLKNENIEKEYLKRYYRNRIFTLDKCIILNNKTVKDKSNNFKKSIHYFFIGLAITVIYSVGYIIRSLL